MTVQAHESFITFNTTIKSYITEAALTNANSKNIIVRRGIYYVVARVKGKRISQSTGIRFGDPNSKDLAQKICRRILQEARLAHWDVLTGLKMKEPFSSIGAITRTYLENVRLRGYPRFSTAKNNVGALLRIVRNGAGSAKPEESSSSLLTGKLCRDYGAACIPAVGGQEAIDAARRAVRSVLRQARSIFKRDMMSVYSELRLPDLRGFMDEYVCAAPMLRWQRPADAELAPILDGGPKLRDTRPDLYAVWLLAWHLAMRAGEMARARWNWIEEIKGRHYMRICRRPDEGYAPKGCEGWVPIHPDVLKDLLALQRSGDLYILPGGTLSAREDLVLREFADWMRSLGWKRMHCAHDLRALRGDRWRQAYGRDTARDWLRHTTVQVSADSYSDSFNDHEPIP